jgi:hypothetical protein
VCVKKREISKMTAAQLLLDLDKNPALLLAKKRKDVRE